MEFIRAATQPLGYNRTGHANDVVSSRMARTACLLALALAIGVFGVLAAGHNAPLIRASQSHIQRKGLSALPPSAQGAVSATLGANNPAYRVRPVLGGFKAQNSAQRLQTRFENSVVQVRSGKTDVGLALSAVGYGTRLHTVGATRPTANANRVTYDHAGLREWYANGPLGVEQGFTIARPSSHVRGPLTLSMAVSGNSQALLADGGQSVTFRHSGSSTLRYSGLVATDAHGRLLHSWLALDAGRLLLRVDVHGAQFPLTIDPLVQQGKKLTGGEETAGEDFGFSIALSADGNTALVGGYGEQSNTGGAAWVFTRSGSTWTQQGKKLTGGEEVGLGMFGWSVALSADGNTALIGGPGDDGGGNFAQGRGAAWVFTRSGSTWTQQGTKIAPSEEAEMGFFGVSVALSGEGNTALVGCACSNLAGAAVAYTRSGSTWTQQGSPLTGGEETGAGYFGWSVALDENGNTALIGGIDDNNNDGATWAFTRSGSTWSQQGKKLTGGEETGAATFGSSVALSADGNTALIGGRGDNSALGAAWVFTRSGSMWSQQGKKLTGGEETGTAGFGERVALSADGNTALIGGGGDDNGAGAAWVFTRSGSMWSQQGKKLTAGEETGSSSGFGTSVALSAEGSTALFGGPYDNSFNGAAWVFTGATTDLTWTGAAAPGEANWSDATNWEGVAPSGTIGTLTFPVLTSGECATSPPTWTCYDSNNDVNSLEVGALSIGGGYSITGNPIKLGSGGITANSGASAPFLGVLYTPITLTAPQTWTINSGEYAGLNVGSEVTGPSNALALALSHGSLELTDNVEAGTVSVTGAYRLTLWGPGSETAKLNATDDNPVNFSAGTELVADNGATGPLTLTGAGLDLSNLGIVNTAGGLSVVGGVALGDTFTTEIVKSGTVAGTDYAQLAATGPVNLDSAQLTLITSTYTGTSFECLAPTPGAVYILATTTGALSGTFAGVPNGATVSGNCGLGTGTPPTFKVNYTAHAVTATVLTGASGESEEESATKKKLEEEAATNKHVEEEATATKKHGEEEAAAAKKKSEEEAATKRATEEAATKKKVEEVTAASKHEEEAQTAALISCLVPSGKTAKIAALLKTGAFTVELKAVEAGKAVIDWYEVPPGAKLAKSKARPVLVASGQLTFTAPGSAKLKVKLTPGGKALLKHAKQVKLTAMGVFTPIGKTPITATKMFALKRG
jgi:hypothetical protein